MSVNQIDIANYLHDQFSGLAEAISQPTDPVLGFEPDIRNAFRKLGKTESELASATVEDGDRDAVFALAEYFAADRISRHLNARVNTSTGKTSYSFTDQRKHVKEMLDRAAARCMALGYDVNGSGWSIGDLNLDYLEPETAL